MIGKFLSGGGASLQRIFMRIQLRHSFEKIADAENLLEAWKEFSREKRGKRDVQEFSLHLTDNLFFLRDGLTNHTYRHGGYQAFKISDPKPRDIHKASVRDRLLHHAIYRVLYPFFDRTFISDSFSCRIGKGTHAALHRFRSFARIVSRNNTRTCWVLKCDIRKFFASIDHAILMKILRSYIQDQNALWLLSEVVGSFSSIAPGKGLPLGNLTSQLLVNVYMNEFDQYVKHGLRFKCYIRYADDFVFLSEDSKILEALIPVIACFLEEKLKLSLHPNKVSIRTWASGVDFLGWINFPDHKVLRTTTKRRMVKRVIQNPKEPTINSYLGMLKHGNARRLSGHLKNLHIR